MLRSTVIGIFVGMSVALFAASFGFAMTEQYQLAVQFMCGSFASGLIALIGGRDER